MLRSGSQRLPVASPRATWPRSLTTTPAALPPPTSWSPTRLTLPSPAPPAGLASPPPRVWRPPDDHHDDDVCPAAARGPHCGPHTHAHAHLSFRSPTRSGPRYSST